MSVRSAASDCGPTWHTPRVLAVLLLVFLCGAAAGALGMRMFAPRVPAAAAWSAGGREWTLDMMKKELNLTPEQAAEIETVLDEFVLYYQNLQGQMDDFRAEGKKRILRVLTPEQRARFEKMVGKLNARLR
ncbi:MAG: hypothetical protein N2036_06475 [Bryobacteraceae bacterium]|nr:hypothetical protein [Bryobacteraceae bacterium]MCX7603702.1 hypothetical protein [Bryobacteraceae bacterium]